MKEDAIRAGITPCLPAKADEGGTHRIGIAEGGFDSSLGLEQRSSREAASTSLPASTDSARAAPGHQPSDARRRVAIQSLALSASTSDRLLEEGDCIARSLLGWRGAAPRAGLPMGASGSSLENHTLSICSAQVGGAVWGSQEVVRFR